MKMFCTSNIKQYIYRYDFSIWYTAAASISSSCVWMSKERGLNMHTKKRSDFSKNALWLCLYNII